MIRPEKLWVNSWFEKMLNSKKFNLFPEDHVPVGIVKKPHDRLRAREHVFSAALKAIDEWGKR